MSSSIVEVIRLLHQDIEIQTSKIIEELTHDYKLNKDKIQRDHRVKSYLDIIESSLSQLNEFYADNDGIVKKELSSIAGVGDLSYQIFIKKVSELREYYASNPSIATSFIPGKTDSEDVKPTVVFPQSEHHGKVLDLQLLFQQFLNLQIFKIFKQQQLIENFDYALYLANFDDVLTLFSKHSKMTLSSSNITHYNTYLTSLIAYLQQFFARLHPLVPISQLEGAMCEEFELLWSQNALQGWFASSSAHREDKTYGLSLDIKHTDGALTTDVDPLYCKACEKLFTKQSIFDSHLTGKKHIKNAQNMDNKVKVEVNTTSVDAASVSSDSNNNGTSSGGVGPALKSIALLEFRLGNWADLLRPIIDASRLHTEKRQTKTYKELLAEYADEEEESDVDDEKDNHGAVYNPLNLPLNWDGKPIPLWLYKLQGLNITYTCEICGGDTFRGERNYYKHFREWKHTHMLKCLGIVNSSHFVNVNKIQDAIALNEKLRMTTAMNEFDIGQEEEMEDALGNVYSRDEYEDHKNKGLIN